MDATNNAGLTPLMTAAFNGRLEAAKCLMDGGADPMLQSHDGSTCAGLAAVQGEDAVIEVIIIDYYYCYYYNYIIMQIFFNKFSILVISYFYSSNFSRRLFAVSYLGTSMSLDCLGHRRQG